MGQGLQLRHLRYVVAVAEAGSLTVAAERRLHTAQPSLSRQIRDLHPRHFAVRSACADANAYRPIPGSAPVIKTRGLLMTHTQWARPRSRRPKERAGDPSIGEAQDPDFLMVNLRSAGAPDKDFVD
jgi:hypothetical protein